MEEAAAASLNQKEKVPSTPGKRKPKNIIQQPGSTESQRRASQCIAKLAAEIKDTPLEPVSEEVKWQKHINSFPAMGLYISPPRP
jgi:hypothetical protein